MEDGSSREIAGLEIGPEIGRGGMGVVLRAHDPNLDRPRAVKLLGPERSADAAFRERFRRESRLAAAIEHPNVVPVYAAGETTDGRLFLVMRLIEGPSLRDVLAAEGHLTAERTAALVLELGAGLDAAHEAGLIHRDVKPANILLEPRTGGEHLFLCDFGVSKLADVEPDLTETGQFLGSVDYVAPEQIRGERVDRRADVYSLAGVVHHMLAGEPPFGGREQLATLFAHASAARPAPSAFAPGLPPALDDVVGRGMAINPADRHQTAGELAADVAAVLRGSADPETVATERRRGGGRRGFGIARVQPADAARASRRFSIVRDGRRAGALAGIVLALLAAVVSIVIAGGGGDPQAPPADRSPLATIEVPTGPVAMTVGAGAAWVVSPKRESRTLTSTDPESGSVADEVFVGGEPVSVAVGFDSVWVADRANDELVRVDPETNEIVERIEVGSSPVDLAIGDKAIWVANRSEDTVTKLTPDGTVTDVVRVGPLPSALTIEAGDVWVANQGAGSVSRIDAASARLIGNPIDTGQSPNDIASDDGDVWVSDNFDGTVTPISVTSNQAGDPIEVGAKPRGVRVGDGSVWTASREESTVTEIDDASGETRAFEVGAKPNDLALGSGVLWVVSFGDSTVTTFGR